MFNNIVLFVNCLYNTHTQPYSVVKPQSTVYIIIHPFGASRTYITPFCQFQTPHPPLSYTFWTVVYIGFLNVLQMPSTPLPPQPFQV